jgi:hypothetical protein
VSGLAVGTFIQAWPACLIVAFAAALRVWMLRKPASAELKGLALAALASAAAFFAVNPYWLSEGRTVLAEMRVLGGSAAFRVLHPMTFAVHVLANAATWPVFALIVAGAVWASARSRREPALCLCLLAFLAGVAMTATIGGPPAVRQIRYFIGFMAIGQLLAGRVAADLLGAKKPWRSWAIFALVLVLVHLTLAGSTYAYNFHMDEGDRSTHAESGAWIEARVPPGSAIGLLRLPQPSNAPYFRYDRYDLRFFESPGLFAALPAAELPAYLAVTTPDYDDRPAMEPNLSRYERVAAFDRPRLVPWIRIHPTSTTGDPLIEIYRLRPR